MGETPLRYDFEAVKGSAVCHYNRLGVLEAGGMALNVDLFKFAIVNLILSLAFWPGA